MAWTERQNALLRELGVLNWPPGLARKLTAVPPDGATALPSAVAGHGLTASAALRPESGARSAAAEAPQTGQSSPHHAAGGYPAERMPPNALDRASSAESARNAHTPDTANTAPARGVLAPSASGSAVPTAPLPPGTESRPRPDVVGLDWSALQQAVAQCQACGLCAARQQAVLGAGHPRAHWMFIGEAPGEAEDQLGQPFMGPAGQLLNRMLAALGLQRLAPDGSDAPTGPDAPHASNPSSPINMATQAYIANAVKCRPPHNRNPSPEELLQCAPYLQRQIELVQPRVIVALGRVAVQSLLGSSEALGKLRGRVHSAHGVPVIVSYHPAYLLRNPVDKARAWEDLCLAAHTLAHPTTP